MSATMMALVRRGNRARLEERPVPALLDGRDALVRVTLSTICTSDLHILHGAVPRARDGVVLGHEFVGEVVAVGERVNGLRPGQRVAANCITFCGDCWFCRQGYINNCERGGWELGCRIDGCQAEYVRVPFLASGYFGAELCAIRPGDTVAVIGAGPVGLCAMLCARLFGAAEVIALDTDETRLRVARERGLCRLALNPRHLGETEALVRGQTAGRGADAVIEAAGGETSFELAWRLARPNAVVALVAMYEREQVLPLPAMYGKNLIFKTGGVDAVHGERLMKLIEAGALDTSFLLTHRAPLNDILEGYRVFGQKAAGCLKWAVTPYER